MALGLTTVGVPVAGFIGKGIAPPVATLQDSPNPFGKHSEFIN